METVTRTPDRLPDAFATPERRLLRETVRRFSVAEVLPHLEAWERAGEVPRELHAAAARTGILGVGWPEEIGGAGGDAVDAAVVTEELIQSGGSSGLCAALLTHGIALPHLVAGGDAGLIERFARPTLAGRMIGALAVTEPDGGSDVAALRTRARVDGDELILDGVKTFITSGVRADWVTVACRTGEAGYGGISLVVVERGTPGYEVAARLDKMGWLCSDTAELRFDGCRVPATNLIGAPGGGFLQLMQQFQTERLFLAVQAYATAQRCVDLSVDWCRERATFGRPLTGRQLVRHRLVEMAEETDAARTYVRQVLLRHLAGEDVTKEVAFAKNIAVAACSRVVDWAVQLFGGAGYMRGTEVERHYRDARILGIGGGTTEIMREIAARLMGL